MSDSSDIKSNLIDQLKAGAQETTLGDRTVRNYDPEAMLRVAEELEGKESSRGAVLRYGFQ